MMRTICLMMVSSLSVMCSSTLKGFASLWSRERYAIILLVSMVHRLSVHTIMLYFLVCILCLMLMLLIRLGRKVFVLLVRIARMLQSSTLLGTLQKKLLRKEMVSILNFL